VSRREAGAGPERERAELLRGLLIADAVTVVVALLAVNALRVVLDRAALAVPLDFDRHALASWLMGGLVLIWFRLDGLYDPDRILAGSNEYARVFRSVAYSAGLVIGASYFVGTLPIVSRSWLILVALIVPGLLVLERFLARRVVRWYRRRGHLQTRIAIVGASADAVAIAVQLSGAKNEGLIVHGFLDEYLPIGWPVIDDLTVIGRPGDVVRGRALEDIDEYVLVPQALPHERLEEITAMMVTRDRPVLRLAVTPSSLLTNGVLIAERSFIPMVTLRRARITGLEAVLKRAFDIVGALLLLPIVAPIALVELVRARLSGVRPLWGSRAVHGPDGRQLTLWLLSRDSSPHLAVRGMPALIAVLIGNLSLVGPRPMTLQPGVALLMASALTGMRPGLTGPWRLIGDASIDQQATQDLAYVRNYTIWEDLRIMVQSARLLLEGRRASSPRSALGRWETTPDHEPRTDSPEPRTDNPEQRRDSPEPRQVEQARP
jgi:lipopolysaccharide/colanic/teichoic acid biosynthesis glycosyltransferase